MYQMLRLNLKILAVLLDICSCSVKYHCALGVKLFLYYEEGDRLIATQAEARGL